MKFNEMKYKRPEEKKVKKEFENFIAKIKNAKDGKEVTDTISEFQDFYKDLTTMGTLVSIRNSCDVNDKFYDGEKMFFNDFYPVVQTLYSEFAKAVTGSKYRDEIKKEYGQHYLDLLECSLIYKEEAVPYLQRENELILEYDKLIANSKVEIDGKTYTLTQLGPMLENIDRKKRKEVYKKRWNFFKENEEKIDEIYDKLVKTRDEMAKALGYKDYIEFRFKDLCRTDYDRDNVKAYREKILKYITPLAVKLREDQAKELGLNDFKFYDRAVEYKEGNPNPVGDKDFIVNKAQEMYGELSKETKEFFDFMVENELLDLDARPGKMGGGYCTTLDKYKAPFIFANFNGTRGDIGVVTHEAGHAFQSYMAKDMPLSEYVWPTYEACEIHSMSMEFLTWPWMDLFFEDADKFKYAMLKDAICFLPYGVTIDHFQTWVYENPNATPEERKAKYREIETMYQPDLNYDNEFLEKGTYWFTQPHVFDSPLYYIDYTLAQVLAFQYALKYLEDRDKTLEEYIGLCKAGGSESFFKLINIGKLKNPMTTDVIGEIKPKLENLLKEIKSKH